MVVSKGALREGTRVWVRADRDTWSLAEVSSRAGSTATLTPVDGGKSFHLELDKKTRKKLLLANDTVVPDMTNLQYFHVPGILHNIRERALGDEPYTFLSQSVLVACNPLRDIKDPKGILGSTAAVSVPHPYAIAESAFQQMVFALRRPDHASETPVNQSIVVGGESGAGKTVSSKMVLRHLVARCAASGSQDDDLDNRLLESQPLLESLGNAVTQRNDNSSRFGKMLALHYTKVKKGRDPGIFGASVTTYLLERSRVTAHIEGERGFHVFYALCAGAGKSLRKKLDLDGHEFAYLKPRKESTGHGATAGGGSKKAAKGAHVTKSRMPSEEDDKKRFKEVTKALQAIGLGGGGGDDGDDGGDGDDVFKVVAAILHLGNVNFVDEDATEGRVAAVKHDEPLKTAAKLLGLKHGKLLKVCTQFEVKTPGQSVTKQRDARGAKYALDALAKALYSGLFDLVVKRITDSLSEKGSLDDDRKISVLDIFGFESFLFNDFEQLLINYANEALQSCFAKQIFEAEAELYEREGLLLDAGEREMPPSNEPCVALLQGDGSGKGGGAKGILPMIEEEARAPGAKDEKLLAALQREFKSHPNFKKVHPKDARSVFVVEHYAGEVRYTVGAFLEKNADALPEAVAEVFAEAKLKVARKAMALAAQSGGGDDDGDGKKKKKKKKGGQGSVAGKFALQMEELIAALNAARCLFVRCLKPNAAMKRSSKSDDWFNNDYVMPQLISLSIPQTAEVLRGGLPTRVDFSQFIETYSALLPKDALRVWKSLGNRDERLFAMALFRAYEIDAGDFKMGKTKVFFKSGMLDKVNAVLEAAASGNKLDKSVVRAFKESFSRAVWRRLRAKLMAVGALLRLLEEVRARAKELERKAEEARIKKEMEEQRQREEEERMKEKEREAKEERRRLRELKKAEKAAKSKAEKREIAEEVERVKQRADAAQDIAQRLSVRRTEGKKREKQLRQSVRRMSTAAGRGGGSKRLSVVKSTAFSKAQELGKQAEDDGDDDGPLCLAEGVYFMVPRSGRGGMANRTVGGGLGGVAPSGLLALTCFSRFFGGGGSKRGSARGARTSASGRSTRAGDDHSDEGDSDSDSHGSRRHRHRRPSARHGDAAAAVPAGFRECGLAVAGFQIRWFQDLEMPEGDEPWAGKGTMLGLLQLTSSSELHAVGPHGRLLPLPPLEGGRGYNSSAAESAAGGSSVLSVSPSARDRDMVRFFFEDPEVLQEFRERFEMAQQRFAMEERATAQFQRGAIGVDRDPAFVEYDEMRRMGLLSQEEYEMALMQQVASEDQFLAEDVARFGEEAYQDYKVRCGGCGDYLYNLPQEPLERCPECGYEDLRTPRELEDEAAAARAAAERLREEAFQEGRLELQESFPFYLKTQHGRLTFEQPELRAELSSDQTHSVLNVSMACEFQPRRPGQRKGDVYMLKVSLTALEDFHKSLADAQRSVLTPAQRERLFDFMRLNWDEEDDPAKLEFSVCAYLLEFLRVASQHDYFVHAAILEFFLPGIKIDRLKAGGGDADDDCEDD